MKYPHGRYLDFLITKRHSYDALVEICHEGNIICPSERQIEDRFNNIIKRCPVRAFKNYMEQKTKKINNPSKFLEFMNNLEIHELWLAESSFKNDRSMIPTIKAIELFKNQRHRKDINCFLLNKMSHEEISQAFSQRYKTHIPVSVIDKFAYFFFDITEMERKDWIEFLKLNPSDMTIYLIAMNENADRIKHELGYKTNIEYIDALNDVFATSYFKFKEQTNRGSGEDQHRSARAWAKTLFDAGDRKEKLQSGNMQDFSESLQMEFSFDDEEYPTYSELESENERETDTTSD